MILINANTTASRTSTANIFALFSYVDDYSHLNLFSVLWDMQYSFPLFEGRTASMQVGRNYVNNHACAEIMNENWQNKIKYVSYDVNH